MVGKLYDLRESPEFSEACKKIGDIKCVDEALGILSHAISKKPETFDLVPEFKSLRLAKTDKYQRNGIIVPPLRLTFRIADDNIIDLLYIEIFDNQ